MTKSAKTTTTAPAKAPAVKAAPKKAVSVPVSHGVGRRKSSVARAWMTRGNGKLTVNGKAYDHYFDTDITRKTANTPFAIFQQLSAYDIEVNVVGGGIVGQADATKLAISRALVAHYADIKPAARAAGLITVDSRLKERKKYGQKAARRKFQFVKR